MKNVLTVVTVFYMLSEVIQCANILAVMPTPFYSHQATFRPLWRELARRGHQLTLITTDLMEQSENITQIDISKTYEIFERHEFMTTLKKGYTISQLISKLEEVSDDVYSYQLTHPYLVNLLKKNEKFDLLFVEFTMPIFPLLSNKFKCPFIGISSMDVVPFMHGSMGNAMHPVIYPYADLGFETPLSFRERLLSTTLYVIFIFMGHTAFRPRGNVYAKKYLGDDVPDIFDIYGNASLLFINANPIFFPTRPVTPTTINLGGGLHLQEPRKLPKIYKNGDSSLCQLILSAHILASNSEGDAQSMYFIPCHCVEQYIDEINFLTAKARDIYL